MEVVILSVLDLDLNAVWIDYMSSLAKDRPAAITGGHSNQDPPYRQKPTRYILHFFANHSWSLLLCCPVIGCGEFGWVGFLAVCSLSKINPNPRQNTYCGKRWPRCHFEPMPFLGVGLALGWRVRRFTNNIYMLSHPTESGKSHPILQTHCSYL